MHPTSKRSVLKVTLGLFALMPMTWAADPAPATGSDEAAASAPAATIHGTKFKKSIFNDPHIVGVAAVDKHVLPNPDRNWRKEVTVAPGKHFISLRYFYGTKVGKAIVPMDVKPAAKYEVRWKDAGEGVDLWVVDLATGKAATEVARVTPAYEETRDLAKVPITNTSESSMPDPVFQQRAKNQSPTSHAWSLGGP